MPTDAPKPRTPEESAASFKLPDGFRMEIVASEPLIASPSAVCWNERGQMFVSELHGYNLEGQLDIEALNKTGKLDTQVRRVQADEKFKKAAEAGTYGVVKRLLDTNGDGRMDQADIWATNLPPIYGIVAARGGLIVACAPEIVFLADRDGDGRAEIRETLFTGFRTGALERGINTPQWGMDGWIYFGRGWGGSTVTGPKLTNAVTLNDSDFRIRADGSAIEPVTGGTHTFGFAMTESGDRFTVTTTIPGIFIAPLPWRYLVRNPNATATGLEAATGDRHAYSLAPPHPWRRKRAEDPEYFKYYRSRYGPAESEPDGWFTAACSPLVYLDNALPGLHGQYFVCEPAGNLIHRSIIHEEGSALTLTRAPDEEKSEFAASTDPWSHPMNLIHGPDGAIWIVDYYREIIEDYSAIPRHLQQQYGLYAGHDRGRVYRLTHTTLARTSAPNLTTLSPNELAEEIASPILWKRQTAQRLIIERQDKSAGPILRRILTKDTRPLAVISTLRTLEGLNLLKPSDLLPFISHPEPSVRVHALQIGDAFLVQAEDRPLLEAILDAAANEKNPRVQIQFALTLGGTKDARAFNVLARYAREKLDVQWMETAILSSLNNREVDMLAELMREAGGSASFFEPLAKSIGARRNEVELSRSLQVIAKASPDLQASVLGSLAKGRKNAPPMRLASADALKTLASFSASESDPLRAAARSLEETFVLRSAEDEGLSEKVPTPEPVSEETFRKFAAALSGPRDLQRGHEIFTQACATCHRIGKEGHEVGPDLIGQLGSGEDSLLKDVLLPNDRIRPGFETTAVRLLDGSTVTGLLKEDGATSVTLVSAGGVEQVFLRKDIAGVQRLGTSLMPPFARALSPTDLANLLAWLRSNL